MMIRHWAFPSVTPRRESQTTSLAHICPKATIVACPELRGQLSSCRLQRVTSDNLHSSSPLAGSCETKLWQTSQTNRKYQNSMSDSHPVADSRNRVDIVAFIFAQLYRHARQNVFPNLLKFQAAEERDVF